MLQYATIKSIPSLGLLILLCFMAGELYAQAPTITNITPSQAIVNSATAIDIDGTSFSNTPANNAVFVGSMRATVTGSSNTQITIELPRGMNTVAPITVVNLENNLQTSSLKASDRPLLTTTNTPVTITPSSYTPNLITPPSFMPSAVAAGDFDGDGWMDIAAADGVSNLDNIVIYINDQAGGFSLLTTITAAISPINYIKTGDFDGDGNVDIAVSDPDEISVHLNTTGTGEFPEVFPITPIVRAVGSGTTQVAIADFDNDGDLDVASNNLGGNIQIYLDILTTDPVPDSFIATTVSTSLVAADVNKDGNVDLISSDGNNQVGVFYGDGAGSFTGPADVNTGTVSAGPLALGLFNADASLDVTFSSLNDTGIGFATNNGTGFINATVIAGNSVEPRYPVVSDFNGDGQHDIIALDAATGDLLIYINNGTGFNEPVVILGANPSNSYSAFAIADFDQDGYVDFAVGQNAGFFEVYSYQPAPTDYFAVSSGDWNNPNVWSTTCGGTPGVGFPSAMDNVTICTGNTVRLGAATSCSELIIANGATLQLADQDLDINGRTTIEGVLIDNVSGGNTTFNEEVTVETTGEFITTATNASSFTFLDNIINKNIFNLIGDGITWSLATNLSIDNQSTATMNFGLSNTGTGEIDGNVIIRGTGNINLSSTDAIQVADGVTIRNEIGSYPTLTTRLSIPKLTTAGSANFINIANAVLSYEPVDGGAFSPNINFNLTANNNIFIYNENNTGQQVIPATYHHLLLSNGTTNELNDPLIVNGDLTIAAAASLVSNDFDITVRRNWINDGVFTAGNGEVTLNGPAPQEISGAFDPNFFNLVIDNANGVRIDNIVVTITGRLLLTNGRLQLTDDDLILTNPMVADQLLGSFDNTTYIYTAGTGSLVRQGTSPVANFLFPVGGATTLRLVSFNIVENTAVRFIEGTITPVPPVGADDFSTGVWEINSTASTNITFGTPGAIELNSQVWQEVAGSWTALTTSVAVGPEYTTNLFTFTAPTRFTVFRVITPTLVITPATLMNGEVDIPASIPFTATGGTAPYTFTLENGNLPNGVNLVGNTLTGIPVQAGSFSFTIRATDIISNIGEQSYTWVIDKASQVIEETSFIYIPVAGTDNQFELQVDASSGLPVRFVSSNQEVAVINESILTIRRDQAGVANITAVQEGNENYQPSPEVLLMRVSGFQVVTNLDEELSQALSIFPNPANQLLSIVRKDGKIFQTVEILSLTGKSVAKFSVRSASVKLDVSHLPSGSYLLNITSSEGTIRKRFVKL